MKHGGSRAIGSYDQLCERAVLDANSFRGASVGELLALRRRGFQLSVSIEALRETWARSLRENNLPLLRKLVQRVAGIVDAEFPIAFVGEALLTTVGTASVALANENAEARARINAAWHELSRREILDTEWRAIGAQMNSELEAEERNWGSMIDQFQAIASDLREREKAFGPFYPSGRAREIIERCLARGSDVATEPPLRERAHAGNRYFTAKVDHPRGARPARNDWIDGRVLQHIIWPAFVVTTDFKLIEAVDKSGTFQRAWVRTPVELATDKIARCLPWGKVARRVNETFFRGDLEALKTRQNAWKKSFHSDENAGA